MDARLPIERVAHGRYEQRGKRLQQDSMVVQLGQEPASSRHVRRARRLSLAGTILGAAAGALAGWSIGQAAVGQEPDWTYAYMGLGVAAVAFPLAFVSHRPMRRAVEEHNTSLRSTANGLSPLALKRDEVSERAQFHGLAISWIGEPKNDASRVVMRLQHFVRAPTLANCYELEVVFDSESVRYPIAYSSEGTSVVRETVEIETTIDTVGKLAAAKLAMVNLCGSRRALNVSALDSLRTFLSRFRRHTSSVGTQASQPTVPSSHAGASPIPL